MRLTDRNKHISNYFKIKPSNFIIYMNKNGIITQNDVEEFRNILNKFEYYNTDIITGKLIELFKPFQKCNTDNIYYIILLKNLTIQQTKNLYRFINIKWKLIRDKVSYDITELNYNLDDIMSITNIVECQTIIYDYLINFINQGDFNFLFFINILHEYFAPNITL